MSQCCAVGCSTQAKKGTKLYLIPSGAGNEVRRRKWLQMISGAHWIPKVAREMTSEDFADQKKRILSGLDNSRKGSVDTRIESLVCFINGIQEYVTTSSCSGRIIMFCLDERQGSKKKGCKWLYTSHDFVEDSALISHLIPEEGDIILKFEPLILHVRCCSMESGKALLTCSLESGFKNSGFVVGKQGTLVLAIRSCLGLEVPLSKGGVQLVSNEYVKFLAEVANEKLAENFKKTDSLFAMLKDRFGSS